MTLIWARSISLVCLFDCDQGYVKLWNHSIRLESLKSSIFDC